MAAGRFFVSPIFNSSLFPVKLHQKVFALATIVCLGSGLSGCQKSDSLTEVAVAAPQATARPKPTATPDKAAAKAAAWRELNAMPTWARGATVHHGYTKEKVVALTFDDGPFPTYTRQVLDILKKNDIRATFFMIGSMVKAYPKIALEVRDAGHVIANHSWSHPSRPKAPVGEVDKTTAILKSVMGEGVMAPLFRPPYGILKNGMAAAASQEKMGVMIWSSAGTDWSKKSTPGSITSMVLRDVAPGGIVLLHDGGGNRSSTVRALPVIISTLRGKGYRFVTLPELMRMGAPPAPKPKTPKAKAAPKKAASPKKPKP